MRPVFQFLGTEMISEWSANEQRCPSPLRPKADVSSVTRNDATTGSQKQLSANPYSNPKVRRAYETPLPLPTLPDACQRSAYYGDHNRKKRGDKSCTGLETKRNMPVMYMFDVKNQKFSANKLG